MADVNRGNRPLSPFMFVKYYRLQMTAFSSVMVRITGNALIAASFLCVDWLIRSWVGDIVMFLSVWALWYHLGGGIRHLIWDAGYCLDVDVSEKMGWAMIIGATILTVLTAFVV